MTGINTNSFRMLEKSVDFLWAKQTAIMDNISNSTTPGYKAKTVRFEELFDEKIRAAAESKTGNYRANMLKAIEDSDWTVMEAQEYNTMDENGVDVTEQSVEAVRTAYQLQSLYREISANFTLISTAIGGS